MRSMTNCMYSVYEYQYVHSYIQTYTQHTYTTPHMKHRTLGVCFFLRQSDHVVFSPPSSFFFCLFSRLLRIVTIYMGSYYVCMWRNVCTCKYVCVYAYVAHKLIRFLLLEYAQHKIIRTHSFLRYKKICKMNTPASKRAMSKTHPMQLNRILNTFSFS